MNRINDAQRSSAHLVSVLCAIALVTACSGGGGETGLLAMEEGSTLVLGERLASGFEAADTGDFLFRPMDVSVFGDTVLVVDNGNDRIVFLDRDLRFLAAVGATGEGPGEFRAPDVARVTDTEIWIKEINNGRFSVFDRAGRFKRTVSQAGSFGSFGVMSDGRPIVPAPSPTYHLLRIDGDHKAHLAPRPDSADGALANAIRTAKRESWVAVTAGDTLHVFDDTYGTLSKHAPSGELVMVRELPPTLLDSLRSHALELAESLANFGVNEYGVPLIKTLGVTQDGNLIMPMVAGSTIGLVIDPHSYRARRIVMHANEPSRAFLRDARRLALSSDRIYVLGGDEIRSYALSTGS